MKVTQYILGQKFNLYSKGKHSQSNQTIVKKRGLSKYLTDVIGNKFHCDFKMQKKGIAKTSSYSEKQYKKKDLNLVEFTDKKGKQILNAKLCNCTCKYYLKLASCAHLIAYFIFQKPSKFVIKTKRGRTPFTSKALNKN